MTLNSLRREHAGAHRLDALLDSASLERQLVVGLWPMLLHIHTPTHAPTQALRPDGPAYSSWCSCTMTAFYLKTYCNLRFVSAWLVQFSQLR